MCCCFVQTYFCSALSSKIRQLRLKRKQASASGESQSKKLDRRQAPMEVAISSLQETKKSFSEADFNSHVCEIKVFFSATIFTSVQQSCLFQLMSFSASLLSSSLHLSVGTTSARRHCWFLKCAFAYISTISYTIFTKSVGWADRVDWCNSYTAAVVMLCSNCSHMYHVQTTLRVWSMGHWLLTVKECPISKIFSRNISDIFCFKLMLSLFTSPNVCWLEM